MSVISSDVAESSVSSMTETKYCMRIILLWCGTDAPRRRALTRTTNTPASIRHRFPLLVAVARSSGRADNAGMSQRIIRAGEGEVLGSIDGCRDRFLIDSKDWGGRFAVVEHLLAPHSIAAPMHRHTKEDEFSLILEGEVGYHAAGEELTATVGDLVFKPRGEWHTFWNAADLPARVLEIISPGGLEEAFRLIDTASPDMDLGPVIEPYGCEGDMEATLPVMEKHSLTFG